MRLPRCCKRCAPQRILSSNSLTLALVVAFSAGLLVFIAGTLLVRYADVLSSWMPGNSASNTQTGESVDPRARAILGLQEPLVASPPPSPPHVPASSEALPWTYDIVGSSVDVEFDEKLDMIERLVVLDSSWSRSVLERVRAQEDDARIISALALKPGNTA